MKKSPAPKKSAKLAKKLRFEKGFSRNPMLMVAGILIILLGLGFIINRYSPSSTSTSTGDNYITNKSITPDSFEKVDDAVYTLYYPKGYKKVAPDNNEIYRFENASTKAAAPEAVLFSEEKLSRSLPKPDYALCQRIGETFRQKSEDDIKVEVSAGGIQGGQGVGCKITNVSPVGGGINDAVVVVYKSLWYEQGTNYTIYKVMGRFFKNASKEEAQKLNAAVDLFALK